MKRMLPLSVLMLACASCQSPTDSAGEPADTLAPICGDAPAYAPGTQVFSDETAAWGLTGVEGVRIAAVDFDGDGWTDLVAARGNADRDDFANDVRHTWLLRNVEGTGFEDVTEASGFRTDRVSPLGRPGAVFVWADVDNDGDLDAWTGLEDPGRSTGAASEIVLNNGDGTFTLAETSAASDPVTPGGASFTDADRDGFVDLWVGNATISGVPQQDTLYAGDGTGGFTDVTAERGLTTRPWASIYDLNNALSHSNSWGAGACDLDADGFPELFSTSYGRAPNLLFAGSADGYTNASIATGFAFDPRVDWSDNQSARCYCKYNRDDDGCADLPLPLSVCNSVNDAFRWNHSTDRNAYRLGGNSGGSYCADVDNDGVFDMLLAQLVHWDVGSSSDPTEILFGTGDLSFERPGPAALGLTRQHATADWDDGDISASLFDFDNDGLTDLYVGNTDYPDTQGILYRQTSPRQFEQVAFADGIEHPRSHGSAVADFDRDGDLDIVVGHSGMRCEYGGCLETQNFRLFENQLGGNFVQLELEGVVANRSAIGAIVTVTSGELVQTKQVTGGMGHKGQQDDLALHFGLADGCEASVSIQWPDAELTTQSFTVPAGYRFHVVQGEQPIAE